MGDVLALKHRVHKSSESTAVARLRSLWMSCYYRRTIYKTSAPSSRRESTPTYNFPGCVAEATRRRRASPGSERWPKIEDRGQFLIRPTRRLLWSHLDKQFLLRGFVFFSGPPRRNAVTFAVPCGGASPFSNDLDLVHTSRPRRAGFRWGQPENICVLDGAHVKPRYPPPLNSQSSPSIYLPRARTAGQKPEG